MIALLLSLAVPAAFAQDASAGDGVADEDEFEFLSEGDRAAAEAEAAAVSGDSFSLYEDEVLEGFQVEAKPEAGNPALASRSPLEGHFQAKVIETHSDSVVVELPVLLGSSDHFTGDYWLIGEVFVDGQKVGETRQLVTRASLAPSGSLAFLKLHAPVDESAGKVEVRVTRMSPGGDATPLFSREALYRL